MFNLNKVIIVGTITREIDVKFTPKGTAIAQVSLAINREWKDDQKNKHKETTFIDVEFWGRSAEVLGDYCGKGHTIYVEGRLKQDTWDDKTTGQKRSRIKVVCEEFKFVDKPKAEKEAGKGEGEPPERPKDRPKPPEDPDLDQPQDDIPFN